eukprot:gb/GECG01006702.1/.p1 GENE.gb/GECG01006702.1/~~gb/GECG01006702.1/.p1  ORF type:complete len:537 (+),score=117.30 gb/GECG01006702.1/:1-1611(+)
MNRRSHSPISSPQRHRRDDGEQQSRNKASKRTQSQNRTTQGGENGQEPEPAFDVGDSDALYEQFMYGYERVNDEQQRWQENETADSAAERAMRAAEEALKPTSLDLEENQQQYSYEHDDSHRTYTRGNAGTRREESAESMASETTSYQQPSSFQNYGQTTPPHEYSNRQSPQMNTSTSSAQANVQGKSVTGGGPTSPGSQGSPHSRIPVRRSGFESSSPSKQRPHTSPPKSSPNTARTRTSNSARTSSSAAGGSKPTGKSSAETSTQAVKPRKSASGASKSNAPPKKSSAAAATTNSSSTSGKPPQKAAGSSWKLNQQLTPSFSCEVDNNLPASAQITYLTSQLNIAHDEYVSLASYTKDISEQLNALQQSQQKEQNEIKRLRKEVQREQNEKRQHQKNEEDMTKRLNDLSDRLKELQKERTEKAKAAKEADDQASNKDIRLNRALDSNNKLKQRVQELEEMLKERNTDEKETVNQLRKDMRKLERQKSELVAGFKKQMRLIDILKRQKIHMEAARLLTFTEDEFSKTLEHGKDLV